MKNPIADRAWIVGRGIVGADVEVGPCSPVPWAAQRTDSTRVSVGHAPPSDESGDGGRSMSYGIRLGLVAIVTIAFGVLASVSPAFACDTIADAEFWSDNCLTDWNNYRVSDLTSGVQNILRYDSRPGWVSSVDGVYGTSGGGGATPAAVKSFQTWAGLNDDGITGFYTWSALDDDFDLEGTTPNYKYYEIGSSSSRMAVNKSNYQAYIRKPNDYWVRVDAWRSTGTTTYPY